MHWHLQKNSNRLAQDSSTLASLYIRAFPFFHLGTCQSSVLSQSLGQQRNQDSFVMTAVVATAAVAVAVAVACAVFVLFLWK